MPTSVWTVGEAEPPQAAAVTKRAATAAIREPVLAIEIPPAFMDLYLNSLMVGRHLSSLPIRDPAQSLAHTSVGGRDKAHDSVRGEDHDQDQNRPVGDRLSLIHISEPTRLGMISY